MPLRAGDWVEVRSREEILATLDSQGALEGMPFMPEMLQHCGRRFQVWKRAHKSCDTIGSSGGRKLPNAVHLQELRCDGAAHGGCGAACLLFWKTQWLKPVSRDGTSSLAAAHGLKPGCTEEHLHKAACSPADSGEPVYACQATRLLEATTLLPWWHFSQYLEDCTSRNTTPWRVAAGACFALYRGIVTRTQRVSTAWSYRLMRLYDLFQRRVGGSPYPLRTGTISVGQKTPTATLDLKAGELVRVKEFDRILQTLDGRNKNRGMYFGDEEVPHCEKVFRVRSRVDRIIDEKTGRMIELRGGNVLLEGAWCQARFSDRRLHCPRAVFPIWREVWLERPGNDSGQDKAR